jgi:predicted nucleic acid-binding protein
MIAYFDTSAILALMLREPGTAGARRLWKAAVVRVTSRLAYVEASAALGRARRTGRLTESQWEAAAAFLDRLWAHLDVVNVVDEVVREAAVLAWRCNLRGYDAVHCASARRFAGDEVVVVSADRHLLAACRELGMATADPGVSAAG